jgi:hypothetical protein
MKKLFLPFALILFLSGCKNNSKINSTIFKQVKPSYSGIKFANTLTENDSLNYLTYAYMYMGGGISVGDINSTDVQFDLIREYLNNNHIVSEEVLIKIKNINESLNQIIPEEEVYRNVNWKLKHFEFSNMFSYGENNKVNFTKLNGIVGMFAPNAAGKSSLLDALSFCLFDTCTRAFKAENVLNNKKGDFFCKVNFEIDGQDYHIERVAKKQRKGNVKVDVDFYTFGDDGNKVSMNGDQRRTTQNNIKKVIGSYDDFILTSLSSQIKNSVFIEKTQKEKKTLLAQFMGLEIFDKLWVSATDEIREVSAVLKNFKKNYIVHSVIIF